MQRSQTNSQKIQSRHKRIEILTFHVHDNLPLGEKRATLDMKSVLQEHT